LGECVRSLCVREGIPLKSRKDLPPISQGGKKTIPRTPGEKERRRRGGRSLVPSSKRKGFENSAFVRMTPKKRKDARLLPHKQFSPHENEKKKGARTRKTLPSSVPWALCKEREALPQPSLRGPLVRKKGRGKDEPPLPFKARGQWGEEKGEHRPRNKFFSPRKKSTTSNTSPAERGKRGSRRVPTLVFMGIIGKKTTDFFLKSRGKERVYKPLALGRGASRCASTNPKHAVSFPPCTKEENSLKAIEH